MTEIKKLTPRDLPLIEIISKAEAENFTFPLSFKALTEMTESDSCCISALMENGKLLSYAVYCSAAGEVQILSVCSVIKKSGYGYKLMNELISGMKAAGADKICLEVRVSNTAALGLYKKLGFIMDGTRPKLYENPAEDGYIMHI